MVSDDPLTPSLYLHQSAAIHQACEPFEKDVVGLTALKKIFTLQPYRGGQLRPPSRI